MIPPLTESQSDALRAIVLEHGLTATLRAVAEVARERASVLDPDTMLDMQQKWEGFGDRIEELAATLLQAIDGGESYWGTPLWRKQRGES